MSKFYVTRFYISLNTHTRTSNALFFLAATLNSLSRVREQEKSKLGIR